MVGGMAFPRFTEIIDDLRRIIYPFEVFRGLQITGLVTETDGDGLAGVTGDV